jgi:hypothetical protein
MYAVLNHQGSLYSPAKADQIAAQMNSDPDDDWTYTAVHDPKGTGYSFVEVHDEDGEFVGKV